MPLTGIGVYFVGFVITCLAAPIAVVSAPIAAGIVAAGIAVKTAGVILVAVAP